MTAPGMSETKLLPRGVLERYATELEGHIHMSREDRLLLAAHLRTSPSVGNDEAKVLADRIEKHVEFLANTSMNLALVDWEVISENFLKAAAALRRPTMSGDGKPVTWPNGCHDPDSCSRHRACMYLGCKLDDQDVIDGLARVAASPPITAPSVEDMAREVFAEVVRLADAVFNEMENDFQDRRAVKTFADRFRLDSKDIEDGWAARNFIRKIAVLQGGGS